jgi:signal transduction histidine kinase
VDEQELAGRVRILRDVDIFSELRKPLLQEIAQKVEVINLKAGENLLEIGDKAHAMYVLTEGTVTVHDGQYEFAKLDKGECFGEYALIDPEVRNASVSGATDAKLFKLNQDDFYELVDENPGFVNAVLIVLIRRLRKVDKLQKSLADSYVKISNQNDKIERQNLELSNLNEEKNHLISVIAHDIRNPLASSISIAETLQTEMETQHPEYMEHTGALIRTMWRINDLATKILEVKSEEQNRMNHQPITLNLGNLLDNIHQDYSIMAKKKDISIEYDHSDTYAELDSTHASQIFENLVSNAIKFSPHGKRIFINVHDTAGKAIVEIRDQGPGFSEADKEKLYKKFQRLSALPTGGENSLGLGMSITKNYVEKMKGEIELKSEPGRGAHFIVSFASTLPG